jgi:hypothetical protein
MNGSSLSERGPMHAFEVAWVSGHIETIWAHEVDWPGSGFNAFADVSVKTAERVRFMGEIEGRWTLILDARVEDIRTIRNKVTEEYLDGAS